MRRSCRELGGGVRERGRVDLALSIHAADASDVESRIIGDLPRGAVVINVSRGDLADSEALTQALSSGHLSAAALDVFDPEPIPKGHPILSMSNVVLAPHIASCSMPAVKQLRESAARLAVAAVQGGALRSVVNGVVKA